MWLLAVLACAPAPAPPAEPACPTGSCARTFVDTAVGRDHACALRADGEVWCWGRNDRGQLGDGTFVDRSAPAPVAGLNDAIALSAGPAHTCVVHVSGAVGCWGTNADGERGGN